MPVKAYKSVWFRIAAPATAYFVTAKIGLTLALVGHSVTLFWPPSGLALATLLLFGLRLWPGVLLGALLTNFSAGLPIVSAIGISMGSTVEAWLGAYLLLRLVRFDIDLASMRDVFRLFWWGGILTPLISAVNGSFWLYWSGSLVSWEGYKQTALSWLMGDALGVIIFTPAMIALFRPITFEWTASLRKMLLGLFAILFLMCALIFFDLGKNLLGYQPKSFILGPLVVWTALVFNLRVVSTVLQVIFYCALIGTFNGMGVYSQDSFADAVDLWLYITLISAVGLTILSFNEQRRRVQNNLEKSERNLKRAQQIVKMGSWQFDPSKNKLTLSEEAYAILGLSKHQTVKFETLRDCVHPDDRKAADEIWQAALHGTACDFVHRIDVEGQIKWVRENAQMEPAIAGKSPVLLGICRDITKDKQIEEDLRLAARVFEGSGEGILITDTELRILSVNKAFTQVTGYTLEEVRGKKPHIMASGKHDRKFYQDMWDSINSTGFWQGEILDKDKYGRIYPKLASISAIKGEEGTVTHYMSIFADISARKEAEKHIENLAYYDVLTGLPNRTLLHDRLGQLLAASHRDNQEFALLFLDLDRFKYVNDSMGHGVGDELLKAVALRLQGDIREGDTVSRIGGDEFIVLLRDTDADSAARVADKMLKALEITFDIGDLQIATHASIGISIFPDNGNEADTLIKHADAAMYRVKEEGRNNFQFFTPEMNFHANQLFSMEKDLRLALERNEFLLYFQPQLSLKSGKLCGAEALIRWQHPKNGFVSPADFIAVAEETGQILPIGEWVLRSACSQLAAWRQQGLPLFTMSVNLSIRQLRQPNLGQLVASILAENGLQPADLELEITEGIMMEAPAAMTILSQLHELGVNLSIDDFGTGYSSMSYLKKLPVNKLKIDQSFVRDIISDENDASIVRSIIGLGHQFNLQVIAEGVETLEQLDFLHLGSCDEIQGYYFSRPLPALEFVQFIKSNPALV